MNLVRVLYVEDEPFVRNVVEEMLNLEGWFVDICVDDVTALKQIEADTYTELRE